MDVLDLAERAESIADPELRKKVSKQIIDLALTKDGRTSFKGRPGQKWKHGFIPINTKAKIAKAKGSPIAMKRMNRLFGGSKDTLAVKDKGGDTVNAKTASRLAGVKVKDIKSSQRVKNSQFEKNKVGRGTANAKKSWDAIPGNLKTVRNGKRYVIATFGGKQVLTEWQGGTTDIQAKNTTRQATLTSGDAKTMSTAALRKVLKDPNAGKQAKQVAYRALQAKLKASVKQA